VDYNVTNNDRAFLRINYEHGFQAGFTDPINSLFNLVSDQPAWQGQLNETHTFGSAAVNQLVLSGQWYQAQFSTPSLAKSLAAFPTTLHFGDSSFNDLGGLDRIIPQGRTLLSTRSRTTTRAQCGATNLKFGVKFRRNDVTDFNYGQTTSGFLRVGSLGAFFNGGIDPSGSATNLNQAFPTAQSQPFAFYTLGGYDAR